MYFNLALKLVLLAILILGFVFRTKNNTNKELLFFLKEEILMLFLFAEKQEWANEDKWLYCVNKAYEKTPNFIQELIPSENLETWMSELYNDFKEYAIRNTD